jgi:hypothetical protein
LVVLEIAVILALVINPQLDEMGGMLNLWIPSIVLWIVLGGWILSWFLSLRKGQRTGSSENAPENGGRH